MAIGRTEVISDRSLKLMGKAESAIDKLVALAEQALLLVSQANDAKDKKNDFAKLEKELKDAEKQIREDMIIFFEKSGLPSLVKGENITLSFGDVPPSVELVRSLDDVGESFIDTKTETVRSLNKDKILEYYKKFKKAPAGICIIDDRKKVTIRSK
jgi:hypothetical protein